MKTSATIALALATVWPGLLAAYAQTEPTTVHRDYHHHAVHHHHHVAHGPAIAPAPIAQQPVESGPARTNDMFKPFAAPGDGDDNGLSRDPDDCNKGCIGGNPD
jgi:hypothetical protein